MQKRELVLRAVTVGQARFVIRASWYLMVGLAFAPDADGVAVWVLESSPVPHAATNGCLSLQGSTAERLCLLQCLWYALDVYVELCCAWFDALGELEASSEGTGFWGCAEHHVAVAELLEFPPE
jgi:hypothetical protein